MLWPILLVAFLLGNEQSQVESANILVLMPLRLKSHKIIIDQVVSELLTRGHNITYVSSYAAEENLPGMNNIFLEDAAKNPHITEFPQYRKRGKNLWKLIKLSDKFLTSWCNMTMNDRAMTDFLRKKPKFDVILISAYYNEYLLTIAHHLQAPAVLVYSGNTFPYTQWWLDIPTPLSTFVQTHYVFYPMVTPMNFQDRFLNAVSTSTAVRKIKLAAVVNYLCMTYMHIPSYSEVVQKVLPQAPPIPELIRKADFALINAHPIITGIQPTMPHVAHIGGIHLRPAKPLNEHWSKIVNDSGDSGFILFSLGSISRGLKISEDLRIRLLKVFRQLPQTVFVKYEQDMNLLPSNVKLHKWFPLQDMLAHPKCRLLINHGGLLSMTEAMYHGVPVLSLPALGEHMVNAGRITSQGFGKYLMWQTFTVEEGYKAITEIISNPSYRENAQKMSAILRDNPVHPKDLATYWVEHIIRHKGGDHLKGSYGDLYTFQYFSLDVLGTMAAVVIIICILPLFVLYKCIHCIRILSGKSLIIQIKKKLS